MSKNITLGKTSLGTEAEKNDVYSDIVSVVGKNVYTKADAINLHVHENMEGEKPKAYMDLHPNYLHLHTHNEIVLHAVENSRLKIDKDQMESWAKVKALNGIETPSLVVDNIEIKQSLKSPSTTEGVATKTPAAKASEPKPADAPKGTPKVVINPEPLPSRKKAEEAKEKCSAKEAEYNAKQQVVVQKIAELVRLNAAKDDIEKSLKKHKHGLSKKESRKKELEQAIEKYKARQEQMIKEAKPGEAQSAEQQQLYEAANNKQTEVIDLTTEISTEKETVTREKAKLKNQQAECKTAVEALKAAENEAKKAKDEWDKAVAEAEKAEKEAEQDEAKAASKSK